jgi:hypothetical protein
MSDQEPQRDRDPESAGDGGDEKGGPSAPAPESVPTESHVAEEQPGVPEEAEESQRPAEGEE